MSLNAQGFTIVDMPPMSQQVLDSFADLKFDEYAGNSRYRRFAQYRQTYADGRWQFEVLEHRPYVTFKQINQVAGGIRRQYDPIEADFSAQISAAADAIPLDTAEEWQVNTHQIRIFAPRSDDPGVVVPEGKHKDGRLYVFIGVVDRHQVSGGELSLFPLDDKNGEPFFRDTLPPGKGIIIKDQEMWHDVTNIYPSGDGDCYRDTLIVTWVPWAKKWHGDDHEERAVADQYEA